VTFQKDTIKMPIPTGARFLNDRNVGRSIDIAPGQRKTILDIGGKDEESQELVITLVTPVRQSPATIISRPRAFVEWGSGGVQASALVDFINGSTFSVGASFVRVTGINFSTPSAPGNGPMTFGAFAAYGELSNIPKSAQLTDYFDTLVGPPFIVLVPTFAKTVVVKRLAMSISAVRVQVEDAAGIGFYDVDVTPGVDMIPLELSNDAFAISLSAVFPGPLPFPTDMRIIWGLEM